MGTLTVDDLKKHDKEKAQRVRRIYKEILQDCYNRIKMRNSKGCTYLIFSVPVIVPGKPLYNVNEAIRYIMNKLVTGGFKVVVSMDMKIHITWNEEIQPVSKPKPDTAVKSHPKGILKTPKNSTYGKLDYSSMMQKVNELKESRVKFV